MTLCTSLFGVFMLFHGFIRDYIANGVTRIEMYFLLSHGFIGQGISLVNQSEMTSFLYR